MATTTTRLGLTLPDPADTVDVTQLNADFTTIDNTVGATPCTSSTRPSSPIDGQIIRERNTGNVYIWDATANAWENVSSSGSGGGGGGGNGDTVQVWGNSGAAVTLDATLGGVKTITLTAACTVVLTGAVANTATTLELVLTQDATGGRTITWPASVKWSGGAPTLSTTASAVDRVVLTSYNGGTTWYGDLVGTGYV